MTTKQSTITITFGDCAENHVGMEKYGTLVEQGQGYTVAELEHLEQTIPNAKLHRLPQLADQPEAAILIISGGVDFLLANTPWKTADLLAEQRALDWDKKAFMYGRVVNKNARWNLCYDTSSKEPDYPNGRGRVIAYDTIPITRTIMNRLPEVFGAKAADLKGEGNLYYDNSKCGIGFHGDGERRKVVAIRLGDSLPICYQWFKDGKPVGSRQDLTINGGDIYIMSEKAVGTDWKKKKIWTLRHAAGCSKFIDI